MEFHSFPPSIYNRYFRQWAHKVLDSTWSRFSKAFAFIEVLLRYLHLIQRFKCFPPSNPSSISVLFHSFVFKQFQFRSLSKTRKLFLTSRSLCFSLYFPFKAKVPPPTFFCKPRFFLSVLHHWYMLPAQYSNYNRPWVLSVSSYETKAWIALCLKRSFLFKTSRLRQTK